MLERELEDAFMLMLSRCDAAIAAYKGKKFVGQEEMLKGLASYSYGRWYWLMPDGSRHAITSPGHAMGSRVLREAITQINSLFTN